MNYDRYFPRGIASGSAFCNRVQERKRLISNISTKQHTLIMSPRRYGKTSLVKYAAHEAEFLFGEADLFVAIDAKHIEYQVMTAIKSIISQINTPLEQALEILRQFFIKISAKWTVGTQGVNIALIPAHECDSATVIKEGLEALDDLLIKKQTNAVLFLDEMQEIGEVAEGKGIEGALRHVAQQTKNLSFVFSGSNRHLLSTMFYDKARPLYKLCDRIILERISMESYEAHINKFVQKKWGLPLTQDAFNIVITLTQRHPFYINGLCRRILETDTPNVPDAEHIKSAWIEMVKEERQELAREMSALSHGQRKILVAVSNGNNNALTGKNFLQKVNMSGSSVVEALKLLEENDYLEKQEDGTYMFIDPLLLSAVQLYYVDR